MDKTARTLSGNNQLTIVPPSPRLVRSRSGSSPASITTPERGSRRFGSSARFINNGHRSKSTSKTRTNYNSNSEENINPSSTTKSQENKKSRESNKGTPKSVKSPSAWALSPGRPTYLGSPFGCDSPVKGGNGGGGGVAGGVNKVLKYFKQRKVSLVQEEEYHRFRILHNRLLQWRFVNARVEASMANVKNIAEIQLFSVWVETLMIRKIIIQKRTEIQKVKHMIKLYQILKPQLSLLNEWAKLERINQESVVRLTSNLSTLFTIVPVTHGVKVDAQSIHEALIIATKIMDNIQPLITKYQKQAERILYQVTELTTTSKQEEEYLRQLLRIVPKTFTLLEYEKSIRVHHIQEKMEFNTSNHPCSIDQSCV